MKKYNKEHDCSYALGASVTIEMISARPGIVREVYIHSSYNANSAEELERICTNHSIICTYNDKVFARINANQKENCYVLGSFGKYKSPLSFDEPHIVLVHPGDMGNLGAVIRLAAGFNIRNLAVIAPCADIFNPKTVRASMGALFHINFMQFDSFTEYMTKYNEHKFFPFMLNADITLTHDNCPNEKLFSLIFGNESTGLDEAVFSKIGTSIKIPQSEYVDSLNIAVAAGIGAYMFSLKNWALYM